MNTPNKELISEMSKNEIDFLREHLTLTNKYLQIFLEKESEEIRNKCYILELLYSLQSLRDFIKKLESNLVKKDQF